MCHRTVVLQVNDSSEHPITCVTSREIGVPYRGQNMLNMVER